MSDDDLALRARIRADEGCRLNVYRDQFGYQTIGYGHKLTGQEAAGLADGITQEQADDWLEADILRAQAQAVRNFYWFHELDEARQGVIVEMIFQLGINGVLKFRHMLEACAAGDFVAAAAQMLESEWHRQTPARCERLAALMRAGATSEPKEE